MQKIAHFDQVYRVLDFDSYLSFISESYRGSEHSEQTVKYFVLLSRHAPRVMQKSLDKIRFGVAKEVASFSCRGNGRPWRLEPSLSLGSV